MADQRNGGIAWTDETWNPLRGCSRLSEGCRFCFAEGIAARFSGPGLPFEGLTRDGKWNGTVRLIESKLGLPLRWTRPRKVFVTSVSDPFHPAVTDDMLDSLFAVMATCPQHTFQLLTKRPERMQEYLKSIERRAYENDCHPTDFLLTHCIDDAWWKGMGRRVPPKHPWPLPNLWIGVSIENQATADERIPHLLATPAAVRFLSCEPLLGEVDISEWLFGREKPCAECPQDVDCECGWMGRHTLDGEAALHWVIAGGESGPKARPMHPEWVRSLRDQCDFSKVPFFFKQWGEWCPGETLDHHDDFPARDGRYAVLQPGNQVMYRPGAEESGRMLDGQEHDAFPEVRHG